MATGALKDDQSLKMPSDSISECNFSKFPWGGMLPDPHSVGMLCMPVCFTHNNSAYPSYPHINMMISLAVPPLFKSLDPPLTLRRVSALAVEWLDFYLGSVSIAIDSTQRQQPIIISI